MSDFNIEVEGGSRVRLPTGGKYCPNDIVVTAKGGAGGGDMDALIDGTITEVSSGATSIRPYAFYQSGSIKTANFPNATSVGRYSFESCSSLESANFPKAKTLYDFVFRYCNSLESVDCPLATTLSEGTFRECVKLQSAKFPNATSTALNMFYGCYSLKSVSFQNATTIKSNSFRTCRVLNTLDFPKATQIDANAFRDCYSLKSVILRSETVCTLGNTSAFTNCYHILGTTNSTYNPTGAKDGYIYVPANLVDTYKTATNWSTYASQIVAIQGEESTQLPTPTIMVDIGDLYINDYGNATTATLYWSGSGTEWDYLTDFDLTTGENQHVVSYDTLVAWLDEYAGVVAGDGSIYLSVITHADGYESSERSNSDVVAL